MCDNQRTQDSVSRCEESSSLKLLDLPPELILIIVSNIIEIKNIRKLQRTCLFFNRGFGKMIDDVLRKRNANTLSDFEIIRLVSICLFSDSIDTPRKDLGASATLQLIRRQIYPVHLTDMYTLDDYSRKFDYSLTVLKDIVKNCEKKKPEFDEMDDQYYEDKCHGQSSIDFVRYLSIQMLDERRLPAPLVPMRSRTGYFGSSCNPDDIKIRPHELDCAIKLKKIVLKERVRQLWACARRHVQIRSVVCFWVHLSNMPGSTGFRRGLLACECMIE